VGFAAVAVPLAGRWGYEHQIVAALRRRLAFLRLDEQGLHDFAHDHVALMLDKHPSMARVKTRVRELFAKRQPQTGFSNDARSKSERKDDNLATVYLLSTDFFVNGANTSEVVKYLAHYDPVRACGNPFARRPESV